MTFTSITFALFFLTVLPLYWSLASRRAQNVLLVAASYLFYGWWDYRFCGLLLFTSVVDYTAGRLLDRWDDAPRRRRVLWISVTANIGVLAIFKYFDFFADSLQTLAGTLGIPLSPFTLRVILPIGISFYTFQSLNYTIDVYRRQLAPSRSPLDFLAFVSYFPHLVAGPINRASDLLTQIAAPRRFDAAQAADGCRQMLWGAMKKTLIADNLAPIVDAAYGDPLQQPGPRLAFATVCFAMQIYCDFSGYSDIAIGCSNVFGIRLMRNFAYPYFATSLTDLWRRWHISLSTWFRDYVYIPLGGSRGGQARAIGNVMATFALSGLWHGAAWHFVAWGLLHGAGLSAERLWRARWSTSVALALALASASPSPSPSPSSAREPVHAVPRRWTTFARVLATFAFVCLGWVFFRASSVPEALQILGRIAGDAGSLDAWRALRPVLTDHAPALAFTVALLAIEWMRRDRPHPLDLTPRAPAPRDLTKLVPAPHAPARAWARSTAYRAYAAPVLRWALYTLLVLAICWFAPFRGRDFIYFQF